jgi:hypothetical protein
MKLKAPEGVGEPCVAGIAITSRDGVYEVAPEVGALLIECFGFAEIGADTKADQAPAAVTVRPLGPTVMPKLSLPAWRAGPATKKI